MNVEKSDDQFTCVLILPDNIPSARACCSSSWHLQKTEVAPPATFRTGLCGTAMIADKFANVKTASGAEPPHLFMMCMSAVPRMSLLRQLITLMSSGQLASAMVKFKL